MILFFFFFFREKFEQHHHIRAAPRAITHTPLIIIISKSSSSSSSSKNRRGKGCGEMSFYNKERKKEGKQVEVERTRAFFWPFVLLSSKKFNGSLNLARLFPPQRRDHDAASHAERVCSVTFLPREQQEKRTSTSSRLERGSEPALVIEVVVAVVVIDRGFLVADDLCSIDSTFFSSSSAAAGPFDRRPRATQRRAGLYL